jgi:Zn-dependent protease
MRGSFPAGRLLGVPIRVTPAWFVALGVTAALFALRIYPDVLTGSTEATRWALGLATALLFFLCILLHELGHAAVARLCRVPVRGITLFLLGGVAQIASEMRDPLTELSIAGAGPAVSLLLTSLFIGLALLTPGGHARAPLLARRLDAAHALHVVFTALWLLNLSVAIFNLVPGFPMDGGRLLRAFIWLVTGSYRWATRIAGWGGNAVAVALIALGVTAALDVPGAPFGGDLFSGLWLMLVGGYLLNAAHAAGMMERTLDALRRYPASALLRRDVPLIEAGALLPEFLPALMSAGDCDTAFVVDGAATPRNVVGLLGRETALLLPVAQRARTTARQIMLPAAGIRPAGPDDDGAALLQRLEAEGLPALPVVASGELLGVVNWRSLLRAIERR